MTPAEIAARQNAQPDSAFMLRALPEVANHLQAQLLQLHELPTPERCERMSTELEGIRRHVLNIRAALQREAVGGAATA